jgi:anti-sigma B factor antagonist
MIGNPTGMGPAPLSLDRAGTDLGHELLTVAGELDLSNVQGLKDAFTEILTEPGITGLEVDLRLLEFVDSLGIQALLDARRHAISRRIPFSVVNARGTVLRVLTVAGVHDLLVDGHRPAGDPTAPA